MIQHTIEYNLRQHFPRATIIGEEDNEYYETSDLYIQPDEIDPSIISDKFLMDNFFKNRDALQRYRGKMSEFFGNYVPYEMHADVQGFEDEFWEDDMVIWVDPIDGTCGFTEG